MCLAIPSKVVEKKETKAKVEIGPELKREIDLTLVPEVEVGDYVLVHAGFAIQKVEEKEALETLDLIKEVFSSPESKGNS